MSIVSDTYAQKFGFDYVEGGGVTTARGFTAAAVHAGFRKNIKKPDLALIVSDEPCATAATFTQNVFCSSPVRFSKSQLEKTSGSSHYGCVKAIVINSGIANAATGDKGFAAAKKEAELVSDAVGCAADEVLVSSTGVIGIQLPLELFEEHVPNMAQMLSIEGGAEAARAIMTTDTVSKECAVKVSGDEIGYPGRTFYIGGMSKGSGMIMPNMATMISVITTDAPVKSADLYRMLKPAVDVSFNKITVDSDTSTNDTCILMASGKAVEPASHACDSNQLANVPFIEPGTKAFNTLQQALTQVCTTLARAMVKDGEGATILINVNVKGAASPEDADAAARTVANSQLVKTAVAGHDANWGRIAAALGRSGATFKQENVNIDIMGLPACQGGLALELDEEEALRRFEESEIDIDIDLGEGPYATTIWTCDLTHEYISINADYRS